MQNALSPGNVNVPKPSILSAKQLKKLWLGELNHTPVYECPTGYCNTVQAFTLIGDHYYSREWSGKEMILLSYNLPPPPDRSKLYTDDRFCPDLAKKQKPYFDLFKVVADLCDLSVRAYDSHTSEGAWNAVDDDYEKLSHLLKDFQERALAVCDTLAKRLKNGDVKSCYRTSGTAGITPISPEEWDIDSPRSVFRHMSFNSNEGLSSTEGADSFVFFEIDDIKACLQNLTKGIPNSGFSSGYKSEYMHAMDELIFTAQISDSNQPSNKELYNLAKEALKKFDLPQSQISIDKLSSFVRLKEQQVGGRRAQQ
mgnify:CR=1 FL=1|tara:strand:+ start:1317 stop:2249 length:933 start_codon:yes stop_codon:yes gene_type:complete